DINLLGYSISDDQATPFKWIFPDTTIEAGDYLIIWADKDTLQTGLHASFKLSASGESISLSDSLGNLIDQVIFGQQQEDFTSGRYPNGTGSFTEMAATFSAENQTTSFIPDTEIAEANKLYPCFPNPFNQSTTINFHLAKNDQVKLSLYNIMGTEIREIENSFLQKGDYSYSISADGLDSGIYFVVMTTSEGNQSRRIVVVR
ncbi:MAG: T9SS type A sorting domain-containing protein, partial [Bacteroidota bacterium]|nr:T9SS type A sorting domain-containing protein [Bacteroidota bacterium]